METSEILACHHRRVMDEFIEGVLSRLDLTDLERNVLGVAVRAELEERLVPGLTAVLALLLEADPHALNQDLPDWLERVSSVLPGEVGFVSEMGRCLDPTGYDLFSENLGLRPGESEVRRAFEAYLWEMAPGLSRRAPPVN